MLEIVYFKEKKIEKLKEKVSFFLRHIFHSILYIDEKVL